MKLASSQSHRLQECTYVERLVSVAAASETCLVSTGDVDQPVLRLGGGLQDGFPVAHVKGGDGLLVHLLLDDLLDGGDDGSGRGQVGLGLVEPALDPVTQGDLLLRRSKRGEDGEELDEAHDAGSGRTR